MNSDFRDLLRFLNAREVRYLVVGGYAVIHHAEPRFTQDLQIRVQPTAENAAAIMQVFGDFGLPLLEGIEPDDFAKPGTQYMVGAAPLRNRLPYEYSGPHFSALLGKTGGSH